VTHGALLPKKPKSVFHLFGPAQSRHLNALSVAPDRVLACGDRDPSQRRRILNRCGDVEDAGIDHHERDERAQEKRETAEDHQGNRYRSQCLAQISKSWLLPRHFLQRLDPASEFVIRRHRTANVEAAFGANRQTLANYKC
jgi:hypothetical protein